MKIYSFKNAYGIKDLNLKSVNNELCNVCIYASNGIFKSSFSKALHNMSISNFSDIKDRIREKKFEYDITVDDINYITDDGKAISNIIVYSKELYEDKEIENNYNIEQVLMLPNQKKKLADSFSELEALTNEILILCKKSNIDVKSIGDIANLLNIQTENQVEILRAFYNKMLQVTPNNLEYLDFKKIGQKAYDILDSETFKSEAEEYTKIVERKINSTLFDENFNDINYSDLISVLEQTKFLSEKRKILVGEDQYDNLEDFKDKINSELVKIKSDPEVVLQYKNVVKTLGKAKEASAVKALLIEPVIVKELSMGRNTLKLSKIRYDFDISLVNNNIEKLEKVSQDIANIVELSKSDTSDFEQAIRIYEDRFKPKFKISIENLFEARLGFQIPVINFMHEDSSKRVFKENEIYKLLSSGERNALKIIHLIVKYENLKEKTPVIILDDVVETFDYANRTAFLMYIKDLKDSGCNIIILTHNFDFYRVVNSRINLSPCEAFIDRNNHVVIRKNRKLNLSYTSIKRIITDTDFLSVIPFAREITEMCNGTESNEDYEFFTSLLHVKKDSKNILVSEVIERIIKVLPAADFNQYSSDHGRSFLDLIINHPFSENEETDDLKAKLALSMAIRIVLEEKVISEKYELIENCNSNQTIYLFDNYKHEFSEEGYNVFERVLLCTPEFIHYNSFMYEPLVDISSKDLYSLHKDIKKIDSFYS